MTTRSSPRRAVAQQARLPEPADAAAEAEAAAYWARVSRENVERAQGDLRASTLGVALAAAVPLWIAQLERLDEDAYAALWDHGRLDEIAWAIGERGDKLLFRSKPGETAAMFNLTAEAIALLAFCPGGVTIFGQHWEAARTGDATCRRCRRPVRRCACGDARAG